MKKILLIILAVVCLAGLVFGADLLLENMYWSSDSEAKIASLDRFEETIQEEAENNAWLHEEFMDNYADYSEALTAEQLAYVQKMKDCVIKYFAEVYGADVSERVQNVEVYKIDFSFSSVGNAGGYYSRDLNAVFLAEDEGVTFHEPDFMMHSRTIHELVHASGINSDGYAEFIAEGFTEAITQDIMTYFDISFLDYVGSYHYFEMYARQLMEADEGIVLGYVTNESFDAIEYIDKMAGCEVGLSLEQVSLLHLNGKNKGMMRFYMQYYVGNILKQYTDDARNIAEQYPLKVFLFGLRSLFA